MEKIGYWVLVLCALLTTFLVVRKEFLSAPTNTVTEKQAVYIEGSQHAMVSGLRMGRADAAVQVVEFADFQCPACASFEATARAVREKYPEQVAFTLVHFPLPFHSFAEPAARVAECAHIQGRFETMRSLLFEKQQAFGLVSWTAFGKQSGIPNEKQFEECVNDTRPVERIEQGKKVAASMGVRGTPTIFVNGWKVPVPPSLKDFDTIVENVAEGRQPTKDMIFMVSSSR